MPGTFTPGLEVGDNGLHEASVFLSSFVVISTMRSVVLLTDMVLLSAQKAAGRGD